MRSRGKHLFSLFAIFIWIGPHLHQVKDISNSLENIRFVWACFRILHLFNQWWIVLTLYFNDIFLRAVVLWGDLYWWNLCFSVIPLSAGFLCAESRWWRNLRERVKSFVSHMIKPSWCALCEISPWTRVFRCCSRTERLAAVQAWHSLRPRSHKPLLSEPLSSCGFSFTAQL